MVGKANVPLNLKVKKKQKKFMKMMLLNYPDFRMNEAHITKIILFYDGGYVSGAEAKRLMMEELNEHT